MDLDEFGDDDFDEIPDNTLRELEEHTKRSTQRPADIARLREQASESQSLQVLGARRTINPPWRPPQPKISRGDNTGASIVVKAASSDYGFEDEEEVIDLDEPSMVIHPSPSLPTRVRFDHAAIPTSHHRSKSPLDPETEAAFAAADAELGLPQIRRPAAQRSQNVLFNGQSDIRALQARVAELEAVQVQLRQSEQQARDAFLAKQGEISIIRANQDKATREYERRINVMQKLHADETLKQKAELDASRKDREKMETDNRFLQHDLLQEAERSKRLTDQRKATTLPGSDSKETPRKAKRTLQGDGFDDDEVLRVSPSKSKEKAPNGTPKLGAKRKRTPQDSPIRPLSFALPRETSNATNAIKEPQSIRVVSAFPGKQDSQVDFMQRVLNHAPTARHDHTMKLFTQHVFPSDPHISLSMKLMDGLTSTTKKPEETYMPLKFCRILLKLWRQSLEEKHYEPLMLLLDLLRYALKLEMSSVISQLVEETVPLCVKTIGLIAVPIVSASISTTSTESIDEREHKRLMTLIDVDTVLDFLRDLAESAALSADRIESFWRIMTLNFTLVILNKLQPISQIILTLRILATSTLETTFGPISNNPEDQLTSERGIIERLTNLLFEIPRVPADEPAYSEEETFALRVEVLQLLKAMCCSTVGGKRLEAHPSAIGRLMLFLDGQMARLYASRPSVDRTAIEGEPFAHDLIAETINITVQLLYHMLKTYDNVIAFTGKIAAVRGGYHRFMVSMTRIAFAEQLVLDAGINNQTIEAAHNILDTILSPEEGEAVVKAVETPRGSRSTGLVTNSGEATEKNTQSEGGDTVMIDAG